MGEPEGSGDGSYISMDKNWGSGWGGESTVNQRQGPQHLQGKGWAISCKGTEQVETFRSNLNRSQKVLWRPKNHFNCTIPPWGKQKLQNCWLPKIVC